MRRLAFWFTVLLMAGVVAGGWYLQERGFSRKWRMYVRAQFHKRGMDVSMRLLTLDPFRGLVAKEVKVHDPRNHRSVLAVIDQAVLGVNYANVFRAKPSLDSIELHEARLSLPVNPDDPASETMNIAHLSAHLFFPLHQFYLSHGTARVEGILVSAAGRLANPRDFRWTDRPGESPGAIFSRIAAELKGIKYEGQRPALDIQFRGDLAHPAEISAQIALHAADFRRKKYVVRRLDLLAECRDGGAELKQLEISDAKGELHAAGRYSFSSRELALQLGSTLDLPQLNRAFALFPALADLAFRGSQEVSATLRGTVGRAAGLVVLGRISTGPFTFREEAFSGLTAEGSWDGERWSVRNLRLTHRSGVLEGDALQLPGSFHAQFHGAIDPRAFTSFLPDAMAKWVNQCEFTDAPAFDAEVDGAAPSSSDLQAGGHIHFRGGTYLGTALQGASTFHFFKNGLTVAPFPESSGDIGLIFDLGRSEVRREKIPEDAMGKL